MTALPESRPEESEQQRAPLALVGLLSLTDPLELPLQCESPLTTTVRSAELTVETLAGPLTLDQTVIAARKAASIATMAVIAMQEKDPISPFVHPRRYRRHSQQLARAVSRKERRADELHAAELARITANAGQPDYEPWVWERSESIARPHDHRARKAAGQRLKRHVRPLMDRVVAHMQPVSPQH